MNERPAGRSSSFRRLLLPAVVVGGGGSQGGAARSATSRGAIDGTPAALVSVMSKPTAPASFTTIELSALEGVTGGISAAEKNERILDKLVSITTAVGELAANQQNQKGNDPMGSMMPMMMMMMMKKQNGGGTSGGLF